MNYEAIIGYWNGACYETCQRDALGATTLQDAIAEVQGMTWGDDADYDMRVTIEDEGGNKVHTEHFRYSVAQSKQEDMDEAWNDRGEFTTDHLGVKGSQWYVWQTNGGSSGAHDRTDSSGRWIESYGAPEKCDPSTALEWLKEHARMDTDEALDAMESADSEHTKSEIVREIGTALWQDGQYVGIYRLAKNLYSVDFSECGWVTDDEAAEFVAEHDEEAVEKFKEAL